MVIADLSTCNPNAFYELGIRHALRPYTTIVIAEEKLNYPFDVNHIVIRRYRHLGDDIGVGDARRFIAELKEALGSIIASQKNDSPVDEARRKYDEAFALAPAEWMKETTRRQMEKLRRLLADSPPKYVSEGGG